MTKILIIDDEEVFREDFSLILKHYGYQCETAANAESALEKADQFMPEIIFCDNILPDRNGVEIIEELRETCPESSIIMITAFGSLETALEAFRKGAIDYVLKPIIKDEVLLKLRRLDAYKKANQEAHYLRRILSHKKRNESFVGQSDAFNNMLGLLRKIAETPSNVLITGESGTGKELIAQEIHRNSSWSQEPFVGINCGCIPENLLESELFGHIKGAFTGATVSREGFFKLAGKGTLFLDEIGDMPIALQGKLLRVLEQREFYPVGGSKPISLQARIISATNQNLEQAIQDETFRQDLYYRINVVKIEAPSLRERKTDIVPLADYFIKHYNQELRRNCRGLEQKTAQVLISYSWPGNIRQLRNTIERAMIFNEDQMLQPHHLPSEILQTVNSEKLQVDDTLKEAVRAFEYHYISSMLLSCDGNKEKTAKKLGINASTLYRKMKDVGLV